MVLDGALRWVREGQRNGRGVGLLVTTGEEATMLARMDSRVEEGAGVDGEEERRRKARRLGRGSDLEQSLDEDEVAPSPGATTGIGLAIMILKGRGKGCYWGDFLKCQASLCLSTQSWDQFSRSGQRGPGDTLEVGRGESEKGEKKSLRGRERGGTTPGHSQVTQL